MRIGGGYAWRVALNPVIAKAISDGVSPDPNWAQKKQERMAMVLALKFTQNLRCQQVLLSTGDAVPGLSQNKFPEGPKNSFIQNVFAYSLFGNLFTVNTKKHFPTSINFKLASFVLAYVE